MKLLYFLLLIILSVSVSAEYIPKEDVCSIYDGQFIYECPHDHRIDGDWFKVKHYLNNESISYCINDTLVQPDCSYEILNWNHPNVVGSSLWEQQQDSQQVPEFSFISGIVALIGAGIILIKHGGKQR